MSTAALELRIAKLERVLLLPSFVAPGGQIVPAAGTVDQVITLIGRNFNIGNTYVTFTPLDSFAQNPAASSGTAQPLP
ncbi:MAG: hypothetical protein U1E66_06530 [Rhodospirillales bacterium]